MDYLVRVFVCAILGAIGYVSVWLLLAPTWRWEAFGGGALAAVVAAHLLHVGTRVVRDAS